MVVLTAHGASSTASVNSHGLPLGFFKSPVRKWQPSHKRFHNVFKNGCFSRPPDSSSPFPRGKCKTPNDRLGDPCKGFGAYNIRSPLASALLPKNLDNSEKIAADDPVRLLRPPKIQAFIIGHIPQDGCVVRALKVPVAEGIPDFFSSSSCFIFIRQLSYFFPIANHTSGDKFTCRGDCMENRIPVRASMRLSLTPTVQPQKARRRTLYNPSFVLVCRTRPS